ncbi:MAG TPA: Pvc16 family protein [Myxococcaceae bacterium]
MARGAGLDDAAAELRSWASTVLPGVTVALGPPSREPAQEQVSLHLVQIEGHPPPRGPRRPPLQVDLHFLVTAVSPRPESELRMVGELLFAALARDDLDVTMGPVTPELWQALGAAPRAAFLLRLPFRRELPEPRAPLVRKPLTEVMVSVPLWGQVLGPGDIPLAGASIEVPSLQLFTRADGEGRFRFGSVPPKPPPRVVVRAKGGVQTFDGPEVPGTPLTIHFPIEEG